MFEILVTENQLINTLTILRSNNNVLFDSKRDLIITILRECRILAISEDSTKLYAKLKILGPDIELWAGNQLAFILTSEDIDPNPFRLIVDSNVADLFTCDFESLLFEKEFVVKTGGTSDDWGISFNFGEYNYDIIIFDPFVFTNQEISIATIARLYEVFGLNKQNNLIIIGSPDPSSSLRCISDRNLENFYCGLEENEFLRSNVFLLSVNVYHDREFISNTFRIKSGGSFDFMKPGSDLFQKTKATTIDLKSLFKSSRYQIAYEVLDILFSACSLKYVGNQIVTDGERLAAKGFELTPFYKYWHSNKD